MHTGIFNVLVTIAAVVVLVAFLASLVMIRKQQHRERDEGMNRAIVKHPIALNPALMAYVLFPILIVLGAYLLYIYLY